MAFFLWPVAFLNAAFFVGSFIWLSFNRICYVRISLHQHKITYFTLFFRFWYLSLVACRRNPATCEYEYVSDFDSEISYDLYLVNGNPEGRNKNIFEFQYSYDNQVFLRSISYASWLVCQKERRRHNCIYVTPCHFSYKV